MSDRLRGHCPMGCGETLFIASGGWITCSLDKCPNPTAVADLLEHRESEHIVHLGETTFNVLHPLREHGFECDIHHRVAAWDGPPRQPGRYRVWLRPDDWTWEALGDPDATADDKETTV